MVKLFLNDFILIHTLLQILRPLKTWGFAMAFSSSPVNGDLNFHRRGRKWKLCWTYGKSCAWWTRIFGCCLTYNEFSFFFFLVFTVFVNHLFLERLFLSPDTPSFIVQEHRWVTQFHGTQPEEILSVLNHFERYQPSSSPQNLSGNHNCCRNLHMPSFLVQPQQTYRKLQLPGGQWMLQQDEITDPWPEGHSSEVLSKNWTW